MYSFMSSKAKAFSIRAKDGFKSVLQQDDFCDVSANDMQVLIESLVCQADNY